jgi:hypothetical protein
MIGVRLWSRSVFVTLALVLATAGCGKSGGEEKKGENKAEIEPEKETKPDSTAKTEPDNKSSRGYLGRGLDLGKKALSKGEALAHKGKELGTRAYYKTRNWGATTVDKVRDEAVAIVKEVGGDLIAAAAKINIILDALARHPDDKISTTDRIARMIVLMVPIVGPTKRYIDARKLYEVGVAQKNQSHIQEARRETLMAFAEAGLDIGMLGLVGGKIDVVATGADKVLKVLKASRKISVLAGADLKTFDALLDKLLENADIRNSVDSALTIDLAKIATR